jgi:hypothetical protein
MKELLIAAVLLMLTAACVPKGHDEVLPEKDDSDSYVLVVNEGFDVLVIYDGGGRLGSVYPGREKCFRLGRSVYSTQQIYFRVLSSQRYYRSPSFTPANAKTWVWKLTGNVPTISAQRLFPGEDYCN